MCVGCAMAAASAASGMRTYLQTRTPRWLTAQRLRALTIAALCGAGIVSSLGISGSARVPAHPQPARAQPPATAGRIVSSAPSLTGVFSPSRKRMSSPAR